VLFIATHREIVIEYVYQYYLFPKMKKKNEILMYLCHKNADIFLAAKYCILKWWNSVHPTIQIVYCVYISLSERVLGWFSPMLFIATQGEKIHTIDHNVSQAHVLFCDFFKQSI